MHGLCQSVDLALRESLNDHLRVSSADSTDAAAPAVRPSTADGTERSRATAAALVATLAFAWGPLIVKEAELEGLAFGFWRVWLSAIAYGAWLLAGGRRFSWALMRRARHRVESLSGVNLALFFSAVKLTSIANATLIITLQPILIMFVAHRWFAERARLTDVLWTTVAIAGVTIVVLGAQDAERPAIWAGTCSRWERWSPSRPTS